MNELKRYMAGIDDDDDQVMWEVGNDTCLIGVIDFYVADEVDAYIEKHLAKDCEWAFLERVDPDKHRYRTCRGVISERWNASTIFNFCPYCGGKIVAAPTEGKAE